VWNCPNKLLIASSLLLCLSAGVLAADDDITNGAIGQSTIDSCQRNMGRTISQLVGGAPLIFANLAVGENGASHPGLAAALGVTNSPRNSQDGIEFTSDLEFAVTDYIKAHPCYRAYERTIQLGEEDTSGVNRAVLQMQLPYTDLQTLTVEYLPGEYRQNYLFKSVFGFELRDGDGRVVFSRSHAQQYRRTCFQEAATNNCLDLQGNPIDVNAAWVEVLSRGVANLLAGTASEMDQWYESLQQLRDQFFDRRFSDEIEISAAQARNRDALAQPYLFVQTPMPRVNINGLLAGLSERGYSAEQYNRNDLQSYYNIYFRGQLDSALREAIDLSGDATNSRILLLSDAQSKAFANAMIIACAEQGRGANEEDCLEPVILIETLCGEDAGLNPRIRDKCLLSSMSFGRSLTRVSEEQLDNVGQAEQRIQLAGHLRSPDNRSATATTPCFNPETEQLAGHTVGISEAYIRVGNSVQNDDRVYLMDAASQALTMQASCMAETIVSTYQSMLSAN